MMVCIMGFSDDGERTAFKVRILGLRGHDGVPFFGETKVWK